MHISGVEGRVYALYIATYVYIIWHGVSERVSVLPGGVVSMSSGSFDLMSASCEEKQAVDFTSAPVLGHFCGSSCSLFLGHSLM